MAITIIPIIPATIEIINPTNDLGVICAKDIILVIPPTVNSQNLKLAATTSHRSTFKGRPSGTL